MKKPRNPYKKIRFKWLDAVSDDGWKTVDEALYERPHPVETTGYVLAEEAGYITIATSLSWSEDRNTWEVNGYICIPKVWTNR